MVESCWCHSADVHGLLNIRVQCVSTGFQQGWTCFHDHIVLTVWIGFLHVLYTRMMESGDLV